MAKKLNKKAMPGFTLIELLIVVAIIGILAAVAIPQYGKYRRAAFNSAAQSAYHAVAIAQENYFINYGAYTTDYGLLIYESGLTIDKNVLYGPISLIIVAEPPAYTFSLNHVSENSTTYTYSNDGGELIKTDGPRITVNDPTVP